VAKGTALTFDLGGKKKGGGKKKSKLPWARIKVINKAGKDTPYWQPSRQSVKGKGGKGGGSLFIF